uniref:Centromere protein J n=1 Tax=Varanus komodoensis TaxID=61221 RepID=A0A8D2JAX7_VARKO
MKMATSADLNWEENLMAHWMANSSRAGVILNPAFPTLKAARAIGIENTLSSSLHSSSSTSLSEDSLPSGQASGQALDLSSPCAEKSDTSKGLFLPSLAKKEQVLLGKDAAAQRKAQQTDVECDKCHNLDEDCNTELLLQKLEQLKGLQQYKQEQLRRQQMGQIQRLLEEQQKLLSMVSEQQIAQIIIRNSCITFRSGDTCSFILLCFTRFDSEICVPSNRPIPATIQERTQTFEEFLEEQIQLEEQRLSQKDVKDAGKPTFQKPVTKKPFLKRGEGLARFTNPKSKVSKQKESKVALHPDASEVKNAVKAEKPQLNRKMALSNKDYISDNFVSKNGNQNTKTKKACVLPARKTTVLRNCTGKGTPFSTKQNPSERKPGELKNSIRSGTSGGREKNKENLMALSKLDEIDTKLPEQKYEQPTELNKCLRNSSEKDSELSFEVSFQKKLENWETEKEKEKNELDEFLFLEQVADEISFASNSSLVITILDQGQQISTGRRLSSTPVKSRHRQNDVLDITEVNSRNGEQCISQEANNERDSSTAIATQAPGVLKDNQNKTIIKMLPAIPTAEFQDFGNTEWDEDKSNESSDTTSDEEFEITIKPVSERAQKLALNTKGGSPEGQVKGRSREASPGLLDRDFSSNLPSEMSKPALSPGVSCANESQVDFDDETSWSDFEENESQRTQVPNTEGVNQVLLSPDCSGKSETFCPDKVIKRKVALMKKGDATPKQSVTDTEEATPPVADLMLKFFPSLRPKEKSDAPQRQEAKPSRAQEELGGDTVRSQLLREKLVELETEIERFRAENASLIKLREERENALESLRKEIADFEKQKTKELVQIEEFKKEETRKLQKERRVFEKYAQAARAIPDKKERDEIQALKQQMATLQEDLKRRETKWSATHSRLRDQIETLTSENMQLREEIKIMERFRLEAWKRKETSTNKKTDGSGSSKKAEVTVRFFAVSTVHQAEKSTNGKSVLPSQGKIAYFIQTILFALISNVAFS